MKSAFGELIKSRNFEQRDIDQAYDKIERYKEQIQVLMDAIQLKEKLVNEYDAIIEHSRELLPNEDTEIVPNKEDENNE